LTDTIDVGRGAIYEKRRYVRLDEFFSIEGYDSTSPCKLPDVLDSVKKAGTLPLELYDEGYRYYCEECGLRTVKVGLRDNRKGKSQRYLCRLSGKSSTFGFDKNGHLPRWAYDTILRGVIRGHRVKDIAEQVEEDGKKLKQTVTVSTITVINVTKKCSIFLDEFEGLVLKKLVPELKFRVWIIDDRFHSRPKKRSCFLQKKVHSNSNGNEGRLEEEERRRKKKDPESETKKRKKRREKKHWYITCVLDQETGYCLSSCISRRRNLEASLKALIVANKRAGCEPEVLKCDKHGPHEKAAKILFPKAKVLAKSKKSKEGFPWINRIENWFSGASRAIPKRGRFRSLNTLKCAFNIYRHSRNFWEPYRRSGKTPAELVGVVLPVHSKKERSLAESLDFADRFINFAKADEKRRVRDLFRH